MKKRVLFIDIAEPGLQGASYRAYGVLFKLFGGIVVGVRSPADVYASLSSFAEGELSHVQVVGHGWPGRPVIGLPKDISGYSWDDFKPFTLRMPESGQIDGVDFNAWNAVKGGSVWFRSCSVAQGDRGIRFANRFADKGIDFVAHLCVIGTWGVHSHLVGVKAGEKAWWSEDLKPGDSTPWAPRTIFAPQMTLPKWTFEHGRGI